MTKQQKTTTAFCMKFLIAMLIGPVIGFAQSKKDFNPRDLAIAVVAVNNNYEGKTKALAKLSIKNNSKQVLPATGWNIYFNSKNNVSSKTGESVLILKRFNGNLFQLSPTFSFNGIKPSESVATEFVFDAPMLNRNDQPEGFYIVWDNAPDKGIDIKNVTTAPVPLQPIDGIIMSDFAPAIYNRNQAIEKITEANTIKVFPTPISYQENGSSFLLDNRVKINTDTVFEKDAEMLAAELSQLLGTKPSISFKPFTGKGISLVQKMSIPAEGYELNSNADGITIAASTEAGVFYGIQSFKSLLPPNSWGTAKSKKSIAVPGVTITDAPRFGYRGFMLDVGRNFQTKNEVLRLIDLIALYKLNTFHFHLTDDEGWRIEIDGLPE